MTTAWAVGSSIVTPLNHDMEALQKTQCFTSQDLGTAVYLWLLNDVAPKKKKTENHKSGSKQLSHKNRFGGRAGPQIHK